MTSKVVVYSSKKGDTEDLPSGDAQKIEFLKTKLQLSQQNLKSTFIRQFVDSDAEVRSLRVENDKLRQLNSDYIKQLNIMASDRHQKIEKIVVPQQFFEQKNFDKQLKDFIRKMTTNFSSLEKQHSKLIDHCKVMETDLNYYRGRVKEAEEINEGLRQIGKTNISELMDELKALQNQVDFLQNEVQKVNFDLAIKQDECNRKQSEIEYTSDRFEELSRNLDDLKAKQNRILGEHYEQTNKDQKMIYQLKLKSDFLEHERRLAYQDSAYAQEEKKVLAAKSINMEQELDVLRNTTESFLKKNTHIFNLAGLPQIQFK